MKKLRNNVRVLTIIITALFLWLGAYFTYSVYFYGGRWFANANNPRLYNQKMNVTAGDLTDRSGVILATTKDGTRVYPGTSAQRRAVSHVVGDSGGIVANGAETFMAAYLLGFKSGVLERVQQAFAGARGRGDTVQLTISQELSTYAAGLLAPYNAGAIVVYNYKTGEILCSTSYPDFDPGNVQAVLNSAVDNGELVNRAAQGLYPPGSTFKIVTMASALESIENVQQRRFQCTGAMLVENTIVTEASNQVHNSVTMEQAFAQSCNTEFASLALELGYDNLAKTAASFGFGDNFLFRDLVLFNSQYPVTNQSKDDLAWSGVGQGRVLVTPMHMAMIAGAIANDGVMMEPRLMLSATTAQGLPRLLWQARTYKRLCSPATAQIIQQYMKACVQYGTGTQARINGYVVAGKTGSAEASNDKTVNTHAWFVGYVESPQHPLAIAVIVERGGAGSKVATPIAQKVLSRAIQLGL